MNCLKILLTAFIIGLSISSVHAQGDKHNIPPLKGVSARLQNGQEGRGMYYYDSSEVARIAEIILENDMLKENGLIFIQKDSLCNINRIILEGKISSLGEIIRLKDEQLFRLEKTPLVITDNSWKWWQYTLAAIGAVTFGFTAGIVYEQIENNK